MALPVTTDKLEISADKSNSSFQSRVDRIRDRAIIGLEYIIENRIGNSFDPSFHCVLCDVSLEYTAAIGHLTSFIHRLKYLKKHFPTPFKKICKLKRRGEKNISTKRVCEGIENTYGRLSALVTENNEFSKNRIKYTEEVLNSKHFNEQLGCTFVELITKKDGKSCSPSLSSNSDYGQGDLSGEFCSGVTSSDSSTGSPKTGKAISLTSSPIAGDKMTSKSVSIDGCTKWKPVTKEVPFMPTSQKHIGKLIQTHTSKLETARMLMDAAKKELTEKYNEYIRTPIKHPDYFDQWTSFRNRRYEELNNEKKMSRSNLYLTSQWSVEWKKFLDERLEKDLELKEIEIKKDESIADEKVIRSKNEMQNLSDDIESVALNANEKKQPQSPINLLRSPVIQLRSQIKLHRSPINQFRSEVHRPRSPINLPRSPINQFRSEVHRPRSPINRPELPTNPPRAKSSKNRSQSTSRPPSPTINPFRLRTPSPIRRTQVNRPRLPNRTPSPMNRSRSPRNRSQSPINRQRSPRNGRHSPRSRRQSPKSRGQSPRIQRQVGQSPRSQRQSPKYRSRPAKTRPRSPKNRSSSSTKPARSSRNRCQPTNRSQSRSRSISPINRPQSPRTVFPQRSERMLNDRGSPPHIRSLSKLPEIRKINTRPKLLKTNFSSESEIDYSPIPSATEYSHNYQEPVKSHGIKSEPLYEPKKHPTETQILPKSIDLKTDEAITIMSVLRLLIALEDILGSLGPNIIELMTKAITMDKAKTNYSNQLLDNEECYIVFEMIKEKLKGLLTADIVESSRIVTVKKAIKHMNTLVQEANDRRAAITANISLAFAKQGITNISREQLQYYTDKYIKMANAKHNEVAN